MEKNESKIRCTITSIYTTNPKAITNNAYSKQILWNCDWRDHAPPHFHAKYGEQEVSFEIETGKVTGNMSKRALSLVKEWYKLHKEELMSD